MKIGLKEGILFVVVLIIVFVMGGIVMKAITTPVESGHVCNDDIGIPIPGSSPQKKPNTTPNTQGNSTDKSTIGTIEGKSGPPPDPAQIVAGTNVKTVENNSVTNSLQTTTQETAVSQEMEEDQVQITVEQQRIIDEEYARKTAGYHMDPTAIPPPQPESSGIYIFADNKLYSPTVYWQASSYNGEDPIIEFSSQPIKIVFCGGEFITSQSPNKIDFLTYNVKPHWSLRKGISESQYQKLDAYRKKYAKEFTDSEKLNIKRGPIKLSDDTYYFDLGVVSPGWYSFGIYYWPPPEDHTIHFHIR